MKCGNSVFLFLNGNADISIFVEKYLLWAGIVLFFQLEQQGIIINSQRRTHFCLIR